MDSAEINNDVLMSMQQIYYRFSESQACLAGDKWPHAIEDDRIMAGLNAQFQVCR
jgi:hypothetical protein